MNNSKPRGRFVLPRLTLCVTACVLILSDTSLAQEATPPTPASTPEMPSLWDLAIQGGWFMIPIGLASIVTVVFTLERLNGLRSGRILPRALIARLRELMCETTLDPRKLWEICEGNKSPLANVVRAAVLKTGRPHAEVESAVTDAVGRETDEMTRNLRPINVVASLAPLLGLLGTVQGMIMAFMVTSTTSSTGTAKAQELAHGIYTALVTTFAGLCVAVVSVILANFLEGRIERLLRHMEAIFLDLLPRLERYEGKIRISDFSRDEDGRIKVKPKPAAAATAVPRSPAESTATPKPAARKLGSPRRVVRSPVPATGKSAGDPSASQASVTKKNVATASDREKVSGNVAGLETLRSNFDR